MHPYPPPPWRLRGWAIQTLHAMPVALAQRYVPHTLPLLRIAPSHTLATMLLASYECGSLAYHELLVGIGPVWLRGPRFCIPRIWVDSNASVAGGRAIWKLPKELASFEVRRSANEIHIEARGICRIEALASNYSLPVWLPAFAFARHGNAFYPFTAFMRSRASLARVRVPALSDEFAAMHLTRPIIAVHYESLDLLVYGPRPAGAPFDSRTALSRSLRSGSFDTSR